MKPWIAIVLFGIECVAAGVAFGAEGEMRPSKPEVRKEVVAAIEAQLVAFRKGDVEKAYSYAARELRAQKPMRAFEAIVQTTYPEIWANTGAEYGIVRDDGQKAMLLVHVMAKESDASYDFTLVRERGAWRIYGVLRHTPKKGDKV